MPHLLPCWPLNQAQKHSSSERLVFERIIGGKIENHALRKPLEILFNGICRKYNTCLYKYSLSVFAAGYFILFQCRRRSQHTCELYLNNGEVRIYSTHRQQSQRAAVAGHSYLPVAS